MKSTVLMLYGNYGEHPWREDMFLRPDKIQKGLEALGFGFAIGMVTHAPSGRDEIPDIRVAEDPVYDKKSGVLLEAYFKPGYLDDYPSVIDHWVANFQEEIEQPDGTYQRTAHGVGLPPERLWNHKNVQEFGNHKERMEAIITSAGVGIPTYDVLDYEAFAEKYGGAREVIYKPQGGARGVGILVFKTTKELHEALQSKRIATNGFIQPYLRNNAPVRGVKPLTKHDAVLLKEYNQTNDRPREIRMHVITTTDEHGQLVTEAYPMMKISEPHRKYLKFQLGVGIDPSCIGPGSFIYDTSVMLAKNVCRMAGVPQYYGVFDWLVNGEVQNPEDVFIVDGNCRGPGIPECAVPARDALQRALVSSGMGVLKLL